MMCAKKRCPRIATLGSRCTRHWMERQREYRLLPTDTLWWRTYQPSLVAAIDLRRYFLDHGEIPAPNVEVKNGERFQKWNALVAALIAKADKIMRRQHARSTRVQEA